jgi:putative SOS response-associated peptidase YedK
VSQDLLDHRPFEDGRDDLELPAAAVRAALHGLSALSLTKAPSAHSLVPWFAKTPRLSYSTNNARFEEITTKASFKNSWAHGKRCIIPAVSFDEPNWESGKNIWWRFLRADGAPWGLAGLWNTWIDKSTGEVVESYTMLTLNADRHPLMNRMHKPDPKLGPDQQDKRSVVPIELNDVDTWLAGSQEAAAALVKLAPVEVFDGGPVAT